jgi:hypothetical protein
MKKWNLWLIIIMLIFCVFFIGNTRVYAEDEFDIQDGVLISYNGVSAQVIVPDGVDKIGNNAFFENTVITSVSIPNSAVSIGDYAFSGCLNLNEVLMPQSVIDIYKNAFENCANLKDIIIPESVLRIDNSAFKGCEGLETLFIPDNVTTIGIDAFSGCLNLTISCYENSFAHLYAELYGLDYIFVTNDSSGDFLIANNVLIKYLGTQIDVFIPSEVTAVGGNAFLNCDFVKTITFQSEIEAIGAYAFAECTALETISDLNNLNTMGAYAFFNCSKLNELSLLGSYTNIPSSIFEECESLTSLTLNQSYERIGIRAFKNCASLTDFNIPSSVTEIKDSAFEGCDAFTSITLNSKVNKIGKRVFASCINLTQVVLSDSLLSTGQATFEGCIKLNQIQIPEGITIIGEQCFENCTDLNSIELPSTIKNIADYSFSNTRISSINLPDGLETIGTSAFNSGLKNASIIVPRSVSEIKMNAFEDCDDLVFTCYTNSYAHEYAHINGINYELIDDGQGSPFLVSGGELISYAGFAKDIVIPSEVIKIGDGVFEGKLSIESVEMADSVAVIGVEAFKDCRNLKEINMPKSITSILDNAFYNCINIDMIVIEKEVNSIGEDIFGGCEFLNLKCFYGSDIDNYAKSNNMQILYLPDDMPIEELIVEDMPQSIVYNGENLKISAYAYKHGQIAKNVEYRVSYRTDDSPWWTYLSPDYYSCDEDGFFNTEFNPLEEGEYSFRVETRTLGKTEVDITDETNKIGIYYIALPANEITNLAADKNVYTFLENIGLDFDIVLNQEYPELEYQIMYSKNNTNWFIVPNNIDWIDVELSGSSDIHIDFNIPKSSTEGEYFIKLKLRTKGRNGVDQEETVNINIFNIMPLKSIEIESLQDIAVCPLTGIKISASAKTEQGYLLDAQYKFYYSKNGGITFRAFTSWISQNNAYFKTRIEGDFLFKVEAKAKGRRVVDVIDYSDEETQIFIGGVPAHSLEIETDKTSFEYGEEIRLFINVVPGLEEQKTQYLIQYSTNGKKYKNLPNETWMDYPDDLNLIGDTYYANVLVPCLAIDSKYYLKALIRTFGRKGYDQTATVEVDMSVGQQISEVRFFSIDSPNVQTSEGIQLWAIALLENGEEAYAEYRFSYKKEGARRWTYISSKFSYSDVAIFKTKYEGKYSFKVEARTAGIKSIGDSEVSEIIEVFIGGLPAKSINISLVDDKTTYLMDENIFLNIDSVLSYDPRYHDAAYQVMYSTNGKSYRVLKGYDYGGFDGEREIQLPYSKNDVTYYLKVNLKTADRMTTDAVSNVVVIKRYKILPVNSVDIIYYGENPTVVSEDMINLSASAFLDNVETVSEYRFLYKLENSKRWTFISSKFSLNNFIKFKPKKEGRYSFKVEARTKGRTKIDTSKILVEPIGIYFNKLPARDISISVGEKTEYLYNENIAIEVDAIDNGILNDEIEYQIMYSSNNRSWKVTPEFRVWKDLIIADGKSSVDFKIPKMSRDYHYYIKVNIRTKGRYKADVFDICEVDMRAVMPLLDASIDQVVKNENNSITITANAVPKAGYEESFNPQYRFYYKKAGATRWSILSRYTLLNTYSYKPTAEGVYDYKVIARNMGRSTVDAEDFVFGYQYTVQNNIGLDEINELNTEEEPEPTPSTTLEPTSSTTPEPEPTPSATPESEPTPSTIPEPEPSPSATPEIEPTPSIIPEIEPTPSKELFIE